MDSVIKGLLKIKWQSQLQFIRCKTKVNISKPRPPHYERALVESLCLPYFSKEKRPKHIPVFESCVGPPVYESPNIEDHPLVAIYAKENLKHFMNSKLIAIFHMNEIIPEEKFEYQLHMKKNGMKLLNINYITIKKALTGTQYECVIPFYMAPTATAFCPESNLNLLLRIIKKMPKLILMGVIVENRFLSLADSQAYGKFNNITEVRLQLLSVINSASQRLVQQINQHPNNLMALLNQHKKILGDGKS